MKSMTNEFKVGLLVIVSILILGMIIFKTEDFHFKKEGYRIKVLFNFAAGIRKNAPVRLAGVEIGKIESVELFYGDDTKVLTVLLIDRRARLRADSTAYITTLGLIGEKYIEIKPGSKDAPFLEADSTIVGEDPFQMEWLAKKGGAIADNLDKVIKDINKLAGNVNEMIIENREELDGIMANLEETSKNLKELSADIKTHPWKVTTKPPGWKQMK